MDQQIIIALERRMDALEKRVAALETILIPPPDTQEPPSQIQ